MKSTVDRPLKWVRPTQQGRSERTLARILDAAEALLEERRFAEVSVAQIAARAGCSVGAFYGRLRDKEALLQCLDERYCAEMVASIELAAEPERWQRRSLPEVVTGIVDFLVRTHRARRGLFRTLILAARTNRDPRFQERTDRMNAQVGLLVRALLQRRDEIAHPRPEEAIRFGFLMVLSTLREVVLFAEGPAKVVRNADRGLAGRLAEAWLAFMQVPQ